MQLSAPEGACRTCQRCGANIDHRRRNAKYCEHCCGRDAANRANKRLRDRKRAVLGIVPRAERALMRDQPCSVEGCGKMVEARGLCSAHYRRLLYGHPLASKPVVGRERKQCAASACERLASARGYCNAHYEQWRRTGEVWALRTRHRGKLIEPEQGVLPLFGDESVLRPWQAPRVCALLGCGEVFVPNNGRRRFCSRKCHLEMRRIRSRVAEIVVSCDWCGGGFLTRYAAGRATHYCGEACRRDADQQLLRKRDARRRAEGKGKKRTPTPDLCSVEGCGKQTKHGGMCTLHFRLATEGTAYYTRKYAKRPIGARRVNADGYVDVKIGPRTWKREHRLVMEEHLGRPLCAGEEVHHRNGDTADNQLSNLELWSTSQPAGQRVEDKILWAREILEKYAPA